MNELTTTPARIVLVEDDIALARSTRRLLSDLDDVVVETYYDVASARKALKTKFDVLVSDFHLPDGTGVEVLTAAALTVANAPRILVTANTQWDCATTCINEGGAFRVLGKPCSDDVLRKTVGHALAVKRERDKRARAQAAVERHHLEIAAANADLYIDTLNRSREVNAGRQRVIHALARAIDRRFGPTHSKASKLAAIARSFAEHLGVSGNELWAIESGIMLHRLGSIALRDSDNPDLIPDLGAEILGELGIPATVQRVLADQCERWDGSGPHGREGVNIALGARILAVVHRYVEKLNDRTDRSAHEDVCLDLLGAEDLDPELVACFIVERAGTFAGKASDTVPFIPCLDN